MALRRSAFVVTIPALVALLVVAPAFAKTFKATKTADEFTADCNSRQPCSLRDALNAANVRPGADEVVLRSGKKYELSIPGAGEDTGVSGDLDVLEAVTIRADGKKPATIDAAGIDRAIDTYNLTGTLKLSRLRVTGGDAATSIGGGVLIRSGVLNMVHSEVTGNRTSANYAGGVGVFGGAEARITKSTLSRNKGEGGGLAVGPGSSATVVASTIARKKAAGNGGGVFVGLGGGAALAMRNATIASNRAGASGGGIISATNAPISLEHVTIARNRANLGMAGQEGGGIAEASNGPIEISNTIVALNKVAGGGLGPDCGFAAFAVYVVPTGTSLVSDADRCGPLAMAPNLLAPKPRLGPLADNGGPTATIALRKGSPAINAAGGSLGVDQRGVKRKKPDIGAYEYTGKKRR